MSAGEFDDSSQAQTAAFALRQNSVTIVGIYVGQLSDNGYSQLEQIVSVTTDLASLSVQSTSNLPNGINLLTSIACVPTVG
jgi:hypothetical protein